MPTPRISHPSRGFYHLETECKTALLLNVLRINVRLDRAAISPACRIQERKRTMNALDQKTMADVIVHIHNRIHYQSPLFHLNKWLWRRFRRTFSSMEQAVDFLFTDYNRIKRYYALLADDRFLRSLFGRAIQEYRPNRYPSRYFGVGYMNFVKVLRRKNREPIERWVHHKEEMQKFVDIFDYLRRFLKHEELVAAIDAGRPTEELEKLYLEVYNKTNFDAPDTVSKNSNTILLNPNGTPLLNPNGTPKLT